MQPAEIRASANGLAHGLSMLFSFIASETLLTMICRIRWGWVCGELISCLEPFDRKRSSSKRKAGQSGKRDDETIACTSLTNCSCHLFLALFWLKYHLSCNFLQADHWSHLERSDSIQEQDLAGPLDLTLHFLATKRQATELNSCEALDDKKASWKRLPSPCRTFLFYGLIVTFGVLYTIFFLPETKSMYIEEVYESFQRHWFWKRFPAPPRPSLAGFQQHNSTLDETAGKESKLHTGSSESEDSKQSDNSPMKAFKWAKLETGQHLSKFWSQSIFFV